MSINIKTLKRCDNGCDWIEYKNGISRCPDCGARKEH